MNLEDALQLFMKRIDIIVSMEMGGKLPTKEAYKEIKDEVRKLKKNKKQIHHEKVTAPPEPRLRVSAIGRSPKQTNDFDRWYECVINEPYDPMNGRHGRR